MGCAQESKYVVGDRDVQILLVRKEAGEHWPRLLKESKKLNNMKIDWGRWKEEDEEDADPKAAAEDFGGMVSPPCLSRKPLVTIGAVYHARSMSVAFKYQCVVVLDSTGLRQWS